MKQVFLMGPTASGKTRIATQLFQELKLQLVSVDATQIYSDCNIGSAKLPADDLKKFPHELVSIISPCDNFSVDHFLNHYQQILNQLNGTGINPLLVGGTMMYFKSLIEGISPLPAANAEIRKEIEAEVADKGWDVLHQELTEIDPVSAARIHKNDPQRLSRALEVYRVTGKTLTELTAVKGEALKGNVLQFALIPRDRKILHDRIELRFKQMIAQGFEKEVVKLKQRSDLHIDLPSIRCVGYRQMWQYLDGDFDHEEMIFRGVCATRQLAKHQLTWLRSWEKAVNLTMEDASNLQQIISIVKKC